MRIQLAFFLILVTCLSVQANAQKVSLSFKQEALVKVLDEIKKQTGYSFWYSENTLKTGKPVSINIKSASLTDALNLLMKDQPLSYRIVDQTIVITPKAKPVVQNTNESNKAIIIRGKVTDKQNKPLEGVSVRIKGTSTGTLTDKNGSYSIKAEPTGVIIFSYVGYQTFEIKINGQTEINMTMVESMTALNETVVKGYYNTTKELNTGNVSTVTAEQISHQPVSDPMTALIARVPGLFVQQTSGVNGRALRIRLRGQNSLENGNDPLFIVDGVQYNSNPLNVSSNIFTAGGLASPFDYLNPAEIESIEVLKDADATAIYGSRGANGVILITTKKAKEGKTQLDIRYYSAFSNAPRRQKFMNTEEYLKMRHQAFDNDRIQPNIFDYDLNGTWDTTKYTDWQKYFIGSTAKVNDGSIALAMGSNSTSVRLGAGYRSEGTIFPGDFKTSRANVSFSATHSAFNNRLNLNISVNYNYSQNDLPIAGIEQWIPLAPNAPNPYNEDGTLNWANSSWENPMAFFEQNALEKSRALISNLTASYNIWRKLTFRTSLGYTTTNFKQRNLRPFSAVNPTLGAVIPPNTIRLHQLINSDIRTFVVEPQLSYTQTLLEGNLDVLVGGTLQGSFSENTNMAANGFPSDALLKSIGAATTISNVSRTTGDYKYSAVFARLGYEFQRRYVVNFTARRDASSRFGPGRKAGNFGAVGAAWIFSNEEFFRGIAKYISLGKIRFSYGSTGNDQLGDYKYLDTYSLYSLPYQGITSLIPTQLTNPFYGWERVNKAELALELAGLNDRLNFSISGYRNRTGNQLVQVPLPTTTGFASVRANLPAVIQNSGLEFELRTINLDSKNFSWTTAFNLTIPKNKLVSFPDIATSSYATKFVVGRPINSLAFRYQYTGIDPNSGLYTFKDINGDGAISSPGDLVPSFVGQNSYGGLYNNLKFKGFEVDFLFQFTRQNGFAFAFNGSSGSFNGGLGNQLVYDDKFDRQPLTQSNTNQFGLDGNFFNSNGVLTDASFIRLKNAGIYYTLPPISSITRCRIYIQGQNLATFSKYKGFDPESPSVGIIVAPLRTISAGLNLTF